ncbi:MAG TPA: ATP-dependent DNA helicase, partial [Piscirickettsiaceae bacterium]|nr:ATP-dependent DNA helicase [Piscirickettsiaceae bacterium]
PALLSGKRVLVSTATKTLQDQLISKDLPRLRELLPPSGVWMHLKGRENYVCEQRLVLAETSGQLSRAQQHHLAQIRSWLAHGGSGERGACDQVPEQSAIWSYVCAKAEFCQQAACSASGECVYPRLKEQAQESQLLVVNHHLLAADLALRQQGAPGILPDRDVYIIDEAHQLADVVRQFLGEQVSSAQLLRLLEEIGLACEVEAPEAQLPFSRRQTLIAERISAFAQALSNGRYALAAVQAVLQPFYDQMTAALVELLNWLETMAPRGTGLAAARESLQALMSALAAWWQADQVSEVCWCDMGSGWFRLYRTPLRIDRTFSSWVTALGESWIFTSATLTDTQGFGYFQRKLGLEGVATLKVESPFDYGAQGMIYHPHPLPLPSAPDYIRCCLRKAWPLLQAAQGHALLLFSSYRALEQAHALLAEHWSGTLLVQGEAPKASLLQQFRDQPRAVLLATASFWEGVDLPGDQLRFVMIDKIPFAPPDDPVLQAESAWLSEQGKRPFALLQLPEATLALKQGVGRLIRTEQDRGVLMLCDPRLTEKSYGRSIIRQLPKFRWTQSQQEAVAFLQQSFAEA